MRRNFHCAHACSAGDPVILHDVTSQWRSLVQWLPTRPTLIDWVRQVNTTRNGDGGSVYVLHVGFFLLGLFFDTKDGGDMLTFNRQHGVISQKLQLFTAPGVRSSNPALHLFLF
jgi:hypothetical protein